MRPKLNSLALIVVLAAPVLAYDIQPSWAADLIAGPVHEMLSIAGMKCKERMVATQLPIVEWNCLPRTMSSDYSNARWSDDLRKMVANRKRLDQEAQYLLDGVRWPDDPIGLARSNVPIRAGFNLWRCQTWIGGDFGSCGNRFCLSHFGHWQMAHSMQPWAPWCKDKPQASTCHFADRDTTVKIQGAIEDWVKWLVPIAKGKALPSDRVFDNDFAKALFDQTCSRVYSREFTYASLFFTDCNKGKWKRILQFWKWGKLVCGLNTPEDQAAALKSRAAGAILHLIQDSYARGHTLRVATNRPNSNWCSSRISCTKIIKFSDYNEQSGLKHRRADKTPDWDSSCFGETREVEDPITAGAKVLGMLDDPNSNADEIWDYLADKVFLLDLEIGQEEKEAMAKDEECFGK